MKIEEIDLGIRTYNCLKNAGINTTEQLQNLTLEELLSIPQMGKHSIRNLTEGMAKAGVAMKHQPLSHLSLEELFRRKRLLLDQEFAKCKARLAK